MARSPKGKGKGKDTGKDTAPLSEPVVDSHDDDESPTPLPDAQEPVETPTKGKRKMGRGALTPRKKKTQVEVAADARRYNPEGVRLIERNTFENAQALAGYLGFPDTDGVKTLLRALNPLLLSFDRVRAQGFGIPEWSERSQVQTKQIFKLLREEGNDKVDRLRQVSSPLNLQDPCFGGWDSTKPTFALAVYVAVMFSIVQSHPTLFTDAQSNTAPGPVHHGYSAEDWYRAYSVLRYGQLSIKKEKDIPKAAALQCTYLDDEAPEGLETVVSTDDQCPHPAEKLQQGWEDLDDFDMHTPSIVGRGDQANAKMREWDESETIDEEEFSRYLEGKKKPLRPGIDDVRQPLQQNQIAQFLAVQGRKVHVIHDEFYDAIVHSDVSINNAENLLAQGEVDDQPAQGASQQFWDLRAKLSVVSAAMPPYPEACFILTFTDDEAKSEKTRIRHESGPGFSPVQPNAWQVTAAAWMATQEKGPLKGGILALDCGLGKTITSLMHIAKQAEQVEALSRLGFQADCRPTLILCPNSIVDVWYKEWRSFFQGVLHFRQFYGTDLDDLSIARKELILPRKAESARKELLAKFPLLQPKTSRLIVVCSYETWAARTLRASTTEEERRILEARTSRPKGTSVNAGLETIVSSSPVPPVSQTSTFFIYAVD
jgi:SNF2-related domain